LTSLDFGLTLTGLGILAMFSALALIIVACEALKRIFKEPEIKASGVVVEEVPLEKEETSKEEVVAITAAVMAYLSETPPTHKPVSTLQRGGQSTAWSMVGRRELMELRLRR